MKKFVTVALSTALTLSLASPVLAKSMGKGMMDKGDKTENTTGKKMMKKVMKKACISKRTLNRGGCKEQFRSTAKSNRENAHKMVRECKNLFGTEKAECLKKQRGDWKKGESSASSEATSSTGTSTGGGSTGTSEGSASSASSSY